jgi:hypothetical protein
MSRSRPQIKRRAARDHGFGETSAVLLSLTTIGGVAIVGNMKAVLLLDERHDLAADRFVELVVWQVPGAVPGSSHRFKYRLAFVIDGVCVLRYDNEIGKGDHRHAGASEAPYRFTTVERLYADFMAEVESWRN